MFCTESNIMHLSYSPHDIIVVLCITLSTYFLPGDCKGEAGRIQCSGSPHYIRRPYLR
jgi:hypothetical protein